MKATTAIGIGVAFVGLAARRDHGGQRSSPAFFNIPALMIVIGGTFGAVDGLRQLRGA